jgi:hypothetical protein
MSKIKTFLKHINESDERDEKYSRLKKLGLTQTDSPEDTVAALREAFDGDSQLTSLFNQVDARVRELFGPIIERAEESSGDWEDVRQDMSWNWADDVANYYIYNEISGLGEGMYESEEHPDRERNIERLRGLGLAPKKEFEERWDEMMDEWGSDPDINAAIDTLKRKTNEIIDKHIDFDDNEDQEQWDQLGELMFEQRVDDLGFFEYMVASGSL